MSERISKNTLVGSILLKGCVLVLSTVLAATAGCSDSEPPKSMENLSPAEKAALEKNWVEVQEFADVRSTPVELRHHSVVVFLEGAPVDWKHREAAELLRAQLKAKMDGKP